MRATESRPGWLWWCSAVPGCGSAKSLRQRPTTTDPIYAGHHRSRTCPPRPPPAEDGRLSPLAMRWPTVPALGLLLLCPSLVAAAPHESIAYHGTDTPSPRPWRRLSDALIRRVWHLPETHKREETDTGAARRPGRDLVARYGQDIVLRFTINTAEEASALAEAADTLFLDVWEFNSDWVDIRLAKDVVRILLLARFLPANLPAPVPARSSPTIPPERTCPSHARPRSRPGHLLFVPIIIRYAITPK